MKKQVLGFTSITQYANNTPGQTSALGELSTWSSTYSKTKGEYADSTIPGMFLTTFSVTDTANGNDTTLIAAEASLALRIAKAAVDYALSMPLPLDPNDFRSALQADFFTEIENLTLGDLVQGPGISLPSWYEYTQKANDKNIVKIWLADGSFSVEYPDYDISIVPPYPDLNMFAGGWQTAVNAMAAWTTAKLMEEVQTKKNLNPETYIRYYEYEFVNRVNPTQKVKTPWFVLIYGEAGDNEDAVKDAIIKQLVDETGRPETFWQDVFPELFKRTEFVLYPRWDRISIPNISNLTALYSPITALKDASTYIADKATFYPAAHLPDNTFTIPVTYKSIAVNGVNGVNNVVDQLKLWDVWPDYIAVGTSEPDFQRMRPATQEWVHFLIRLISAAETATSTSAVPQGMRRVLRGNFVYLSGNHNKANYLACMRMNFLVS